MGRLLAPADAVWLRGETDRNPMVVSGVFWLDRRVDVLRLRAVLADRLVARFPAFRQRVEPPSPRGLLLPRWADDPEFDLDRHVEVTDVPPPGDLAAVQDLCGRQRSRVLPRDRPLWQMHVIHGYDGDRSVVHARLHHCIGDGWALVRLLLTLVDDPAAPPSEPARPGAGPAGVMRGVTTAARRSAGAARTVTSLVRHPGRLAVRAASFANHVTWGARYIARPPRPPRTVLMGRPEGDKRMAWTAEGLPLDEVKAVGRRFDATVNDVLVTALAGTLRRYLAVRDSAVDEALVMAPVALRRPDEQLSPRLGNRIGLLPVLLPLGLDSAADRLMAVRELMQELKASPGPVMSWALVAATSLTTPPVERLVHRWHQARSSGVVTSVAAPGAPVSLAGANVDGMIGWGGVTADINLTWSYFSLAGRVFCGLITDAAVTPQPADVLRHHEAAWEELRELGG